jgi:1,4-alpha-glucan branching enzyme
VADLNRVYRETPALHRRDFAAEGFSWAHAEHGLPTVMSFFRHAGDGQGDVLVLCNFTASPVQALRIGVPRGGHWTELLNSDASIYGGSGMGNLGGRDADPIACGGHGHSLLVTLPPLAVVMLSDGGPTPSAPRLADSANPSISN